MFSFLYRKFCCLVHHSDKLFFDEFPNPRFMKLTKYTTIPLLAAILAGVAVEATPHQQVDIVQASTTKNQGASKKIGRAHV